MTTPFAPAQGGPGSLPFTVAVTPPSTYPKMSQLGGVLVLVTPTKYEQNVPSKFRNPDGSTQLQDRMTCDVETVDTIPAGFDTGSFPGMYISGSRMIQQLQGQLGTGRPLLGRIELFKPNEPAGAGNPWGFAEPSPQDVERAKAWYQGVRPQPTASQAPAQPQYNGAPQQYAAPQYQAPMQQAPQQYQAPAQQAPAPQQPYADPWPTNPQPQAPAQQPVPAAQGGYAQQFAQQAPQGQAAPANPWAQNGAPLGSNGGNPFAPQQ